MPFVTARLLPQAPVDWGVASGRVRHVKPDPGGLFADYVIEEAPAQVSLKMKVYEKDIFWEHKVFMPWRYYIIRVHRDLKVWGRRAGYLFFSKTRAVDLHDPCLRQAVFPNIYDKGGICLGYTHLYQDRSPIRAAWRAIRALYTTYGNQWLWDVCIPMHIKYLVRDLPASCSDHPHDYSCNWSLLTKEEVETIMWHDAKYLALSDFLDNCPWSYNAINEIGPSHEGVGKILSELEAERADR